MAGHWHHPPQNETVYLERQRAPLPPFSKGLSLSLRPHPGTAGQVAHHQVASELVVDDGGEQVHEEQASCRRRGGDQRQWGRGEAQPPLLSWSIEAAQTQRRGHRPGWSAVVTECPSFPPPSQGPITTPRPPHPHYSVGHHGASQAWEDRLGHWQSQTTDHQPQGWGHAKRSYRLGALDPVTPG